MSVQDQFKKKSKQQGRATPFGQLWQGIKKAALPKHTARQSAALASSRPQFVPPNAQQPQQQAGIELAQRNAGVGQGFVTSANSPWHKPVELKDDGMIGIGNAQAPGMPDSQYQDAIGSAGDLSIAQGQITSPPTPETMAGGQFGRTVSPDDQVEATSPQGSASYTMAPGGPGGPGAPVSSYAQEILNKERDKLNSLNLTGPNGGSIRSGGENVADVDMNRPGSKSGLSLGLMAEANKNMREGRTGQGTFGIAAPGAMGAMAGAGGYAGSTTEGGGDGNVPGAGGGTSNNSGPGIASPVGIVAPGAMGAMAGAGGYAGSTTEGNGNGSDSGAGGGTSNNGGSGIAGPVGGGQGEGLAAQQERIETMRQWQSMDPGERGKMPQRVRDAFGLGPEPQREVEAPVQTQQHQRELDMRNAGVGADTAHGKNSPWYNPESVTAATARQAAVAAKYGAEDDQLADFNKKKMGIQQREKEMQAGTAINQATLASQEKQKGLDREASERIANIQPQEGFRSQALRQYDDQGQQTDDSFVTYSTSTGLGPGGQVGIGGPQQGPQTEEAYIQLMLSKGKGWEKGSKNYELGLKNFRETQGIQ